MQSSSDLSALPFGDALGGVFLLQCVDVVPVQVARHTGTEQCPCQELASKGTRKGKRDHVAEWQTCHSEWVRTQESCYWKPPHAQHPRQCMQWVFLEICLSKVAISTLEEATFTASAMHSLGSESPCVFRSGGLGGFFGRPPPCGPSWARVLRLSEFGPMVGQSSLWCASAAVFALVLSGLCVWFRPWTYRPGKSGAINVVLAGKGREWKIPLGAVFFVLVCISWTWGLAQRPATPPIYCFLISADGHTGSLVEDLSNWQSILVLVCFTVMIQGSVWGTVISCVGKTTPALGFCLDVRVHCDPAPENLIMLLPFRRGTPPNDTGRFTLRGG